MSSLYDGLKWIFQDWRETPDTVFNGGVPAVKQYRTKLTDLYGYGIGINPAAIGMYCWSYEAAGKLELALEGFETARDLAKKQLVSDLARFDDYSERVRKKMN